MPKLNLFKSDLAKANAQQALAILIFLLLYNVIQLQVDNQLGNPYGQHFGFRLWFPCFLLGLGFICFVSLRWLFLVLITVPICLLLIADQIYFSFFNTMPTVGQKIPVSQGVDVWDSALRLFHFNQLAGLAFLIGLSIYGLRFYRYNRKRERPFKLFLLGKLLGLGWFAIGTLVFLMAMIHPIPESTHHVWEPVNRQPLEHWGAKFSNVDYARVYGIIGYHIRDLRRYYKQEPPKPLNRNEQFRFEKSLAKVRQQDGTGPLYGIAKGYNVVLIQLESYQHWLIDATYDGTEVTPFFNKLYHEQLHWDYIYDTTYIGRTSDAEFAINTGMMPDTKSASSFNDFTKDIFTFPKALRQQGYQTASYHGYKSDFWNRTNTHPFFGISEMKFIESFPATEKLGLGIPDKVIFPEIADMLAKQKKPYYAFVISLSSHFPYLDVPEEVQSLFTGLDKKGLELVPGYLRLAHYTDQAVASFFEKMEASGELDHTIVVVYGDHDFCNASASSDKVRAYYQTLRQEMNLNPHSGDEDRVPLAIVLPPALRAQVADINAYAKVPGTLCDVFPTVFHLLGEEVPMGVVGQHLFGPDRAPFPLPMFYDSKDAMLQKRFFDKSGFYMIKGANSMYFDLNESPGRLVPTPSRAMIESLALRTINDRIVDTNDQKYFRERTHQSPTANP